MTEVLRLVSNGFSGGNGHSDGIGVYGYGRGYSDGADYTYGPINAGYGYGYGCRDGGGYGGGFNHGYTVEGSGSGSSHVATQNSARIGRRR